MLESVFCAVLGTSFSVTLFLVPILLLSPLLQKYFQPKVSCFLWAIVAVRLLLPTIPGEQPQISIPVPSYQISLEQEEMPEPVVEITSTPEVTKIHGEIQVQRREIPFMEILSWIWLGGAGLSLLAHAVLYQKTRRKILRWSIKVQDERTMEVFKHCKKECGIKREISLYQCSILSTPMLMGFWKPMILLPERKLDEMSLSYVLRHELSHYKRKDLWLKLLILLAQSVHWFHPLVWIMGRRASADIEKACDDAVLKGSGMQARGEYGTVILSFLQGEKEKYLPLTTGFFEQKKQIIRRFETIMDIRKKRKGILLTAMAVVIAGMSMIGFVDVSAAKTGTSATLKDAVQQRESSSVSKGLVSKGAAVNIEDLEKLYQQDPEKYHEQMNQKFSDFQEGILKQYTQRSVFQSKKNVKLEEGQMTWPVPDCYLIAVPFGMEFETEGGAGGVTFHMGTDIVGKDTNGKPVVAAGDGKVICVSSYDTAIPDADAINLNLVRAERGNGNYVIIDHGDGVTTLYGNLGNLEVKKGDTVKAGQTIGNVETTDTAPLAHLHFEIQEDGISADPAAYLLPNK